MSDPNINPTHLGEPAFRASALRNIAPTRESAKKARDTLLSILPMEMAYRADGTDDGGDFFENIYWCAFLLYLAGNPADVPLLWRAKHVNMDTGCGFDGQAFVGAGIEETVKYLEQIGEDKIVNYIKDMKASGDLDDLAEWESWRIGYFYGEGERTAH